MAYENNRDLSSKHWLLPPGHKMAAAAEHSSAHLKRVTITADTRHRREGAALVNSTVSLQTNTLISDKPLMASVIFVCIVVLWVAACLPH